MQRIKIGYDRYNDNHKTLPATGFAPGNISGNYYITDYFELLHPLDINEKYFYPIFWPSPEQHISETVINDIKAGKCKLIIDYITESECYNVNDYGWVGMARDDEGSPQNRQFHKKVSAMLEHNKLDWDFVLIDCNPFNEIKHDNCIYFNRWLYQQFTNDHDRLKYSPFKSERQYDFSSFNRRVTKCRLIICEHLDNKNALWSCGAIEDKDLYNEFSDLGQLLPKTVDAEFTAEGTGMRLSNWMIPSSYIHIINETFTFYNKNCLFLTEKTFDCINAMTPFLIMGQPFSLKHLQDLGFKTFNEVWDESYDEIINTQDRLNEILKIINELEKRDVKKVFSDTIPILKHNRDVLEMHNSQFSVTIYNKLSNLGFI